MIVENSFEVVIRDIKTLPARRNQPTGRRMVMNPHPPLSSKFDLVISAAAALTMTRWDAVLKFAAILFSMHGTKNGRKTKRNYGMSL